MKLDLALFTYRSAPPDCTMAIRQMERYTRESGVDVHVLEYGNALIHKARNAALARMRPDADAILFIDDDMLPEQNAAVRILKHEHPVVSGLCTTRMPPVGFAVKQWDPEKELFGLVTHIRRGSLLHGQFAVGAAFLLIRRDAIDMLVKHYLTASDWLALHRLELNRLHVRAEWRETERARKEQIRRANFEKSKVLRVFSSPVNENEEELGEDIALCRNLMDLGIPVTIDASLPIGHVGYYPYGVWDVIDRQAALFEEVESAA